MTSRNSITPDSGLYSTGLFSEELFPELAHLGTDELMEAYKATGDENYKWAFVMRHKELIKRVALQVRGIYSHFAQIDDIVSEGVLTLAAAIDKFDPEKGVKFETYVAKRIRGMVIDMARKQDWLPRNLRKRNREIDQAITELSYELSRHPTDVEVAERLGVTPAKYQKEAAGVALGNILSLDAMMDARTAEGRSAELPARDDSEQPEKILQEREFQAVLAEGIRQLKRNEQLVLSLYYEKNLHMTEIAQVLEVSPPRVSQIHANAVRKLREYMETYLYDNEPEDKPAAKTDKKSRRERRQT